jgi:hypothetical protein
MRNEMSRARRLVFVALGLTAFGALATYDTSWIVSGKPVSAASLKAALDDIQTRLGLIETEVSFRATNNNGGSLATGANNISGTYTISFNNGNAFDAPSGIFTAQIAGRYYFTGTVHYSVPNTGTADYYTALIVNGAGVDLGSRGVTTGINPISVVSDVLDLSVGDTVQLSASTSIGGGPFFAYFSGFRVK